ncbi:MAG: hypothetical protein BroJett029_08120 [Alphaproteobacteria bacterium]|nr:MAG: hypothetical protein BroJett029_08120 [Alphaproteobacteria bacterium]
MLRVYDCITQDHDLRLVVLAAVICFFASFTAVSLEMRAKSARGLRIGWLIGVGAATGSGIWATHFVAMLAFRPDLPTGFEPWQTALSACIAMVVTGFGFAVGIQLRKHPRLAVTLGGTVIGLGVYGMHFVGMAALVVPATTRYDPLYATAALIIGILFSMLALRGSLAGSSFAARLKAAAMLTTAITGLHFVAMAAVELHPDPTVPTLEATMPAEWLAFGVAMTTLVVLAAALAGSVVDQRFGALAEREAARLRVTVAELEETKARLERTTADLVTALDAAAASSQAKSQFLAAMSHELRTPLNAIIGFSEALGAGLGGPLNERQTEYVGHIRFAGKHLLELVNDVLDLSKMDAGRFDLDEVEIDVGETIKAVVELLAPDAKGAKLTVQANVQSDLPRLTADPRRLRQMLINLLSNAIKFTPEGGRVEIRAAASESGIAVSVADTGIGIAAADIPKALERFGQVDGSLARKYEGTGLGLPLCQKLVELHGGTLALDSEPGVGTTVTLAFPSDRIVRRRHAA